MLSDKLKRCMPALVATAILISSSFAAYAQDPAAARRTRINLAVASNFFGVPPSNSAITDLITAFEKENPKYRVVVVDNGSTASLA